MKNIKWYSFPKDKLPEVLLSSRHPDILGGISISNPDLNIENITLGYFDDIYHQKGHIPPDIILLPENNSSEIMAWMKTYAPDTHPLSQFSRVVKFAEFKLYDVDFIRDSKRNLYLNRWSSVILGEILAQGEMDVSLDTLPLSRSQATFSHTIARVNFCHSGSQHKKLCLERLRHLEVDKNFVSRTLTIRELEPIWESIGINISDRISTVQIVEIAEKIFGSYFGAHYSLFEPHSRQELLGDSIELRVLAFRKILNEELSYDNIEKRKIATELKIAVAAFLVGRGTSHLFLLKSISKDLPAVYAWFGLIAGIMGPTYWEVDWARAVKGVEKSLRLKLDWSEPSQSDLSWSEYDWLSDTFRSTSPFVGLPKLLPKVLSIEVIPGATCQFRLAMDASAVSSNKKSNNDAVMHELATLRMLLSDFYSLADKSRRQLSTRNEMDESPISRKIDEKPYSYKNRK